MVGACRIERIGDRGAAVSIVSQADPSGAAGMFAGDCAALSIVGIGGVALVVFVDDAGQSMGLADIGGIGEFAP